MPTADALVPNVAPARAAHRRPAWGMVPGGWDTHAHVFGPVNRFPYRADRSYTPPEQTARDFVRNLDTLGLRHGVLVQPSVYGDDNSAMLDAMRAFPGRFVTVAELDLANAPDAALAGWGAAGVRGLRIRWPSRFGAAWLNRAAARLRELGWHLDVHCQSTPALADLAPRLQALRVPVMVEAMGSPKAGEPTTDAGFAALVRLLRDGVAHVKLSHAYQVDPAGPPYPGALPFARALVEAAPGQVVWGSDWPHPMRGGTMPDDVDLLELLPEWAGSVAAANRILVDNAQRFYGEPRPASPPSRVIRLGKLCQQ